MLVACRLASLSALEGHYAGVSVGAQFVVVMTLAHDGHGWVE
jgi:hypothetical protein